MIPALLFVVRRRWPILVGLPILIMALTLLLSPQSQKPPVRYTTTVYVKADPERASQVTLQQAATQVKQTAVAQAAATLLKEKVGDPKTFVAPLTAKVDKDALTLKISAQDANANRVRDYTMAVAKAFISVDTQTLNGSFQTARNDQKVQVDDADQSLKDFSDQNRALLVQNDAGALAQQRNLAQTAADARAALVKLENSKVASPYTVNGIDPVTRVGTKKLQLPDSLAVRGTLALLLGGLGAIALVAFLEKLNPRIDNPKRAEDLVGAPVLAQVPIVSKRGDSIVARAELERFSGPFAESFRAMRSHLDFRATAEGLDRPPCVMVVSSTPGEGKTTTAAFLALSYAEVGREVVAVGADFRRPTIHRLFGVSRSPGLSSRLLGDDPTVDTSDSVEGIVKKDPKTGVRVVPSGPGTDRVTGLLGDLATVTKAGIDAGCTVILDTPPVLVANDALDFLPLADWVVLVVRLGKSTERSLRQTIQNLELNEAAIAGVVVVGSLESSDAKRYYYSYYSPDNEDLIAAEQHAQVVKARRLAAKEAASSSAAESVTSGSRAAGANGEPANGTVPVNGSAPSNGVATNGTGAAGSTHGAEAEEGVHQDQPTRSA